jgi:signal transduction histidine kinase
LSLLSHELKGPLGVVRGYLRLLLQGGNELSARSRQTVEAALRASDRIGEVLDEASQLSHLKQGDIPFETKRLALSTLVYSAIQAAALPEDSTVDLDANELPSVSLEVDEARVRGALATLIAAVARAQTTSRIVDIIASRGRIGRQPAIRLRIGPRTLSGVDATEVEPDLHRGGFGLQVPIAAFVIEQHGGRLRDLRQGDRPAGLLVTLPIV